MTSSRRATSSPPRRRSSIWRPVSRIPYLASGSNPFQNADLVRNPEDVYRYIGSVNTTLSAYTSSRQLLDFSFIGGIDTYSYNSHLISPADVFFEPNDKLPGTIVTNKSQNVNVNLNVSGTHKFITNPFTATTSFGLRQERRQIDQIYNQGRNVPSGAHNVSSAAVQSALESQLLVKDYGYYAQEEFLTLSERLLLTAALNAERSSVNGDDKKFYTYPKAAASYRLPIPAQVHGRVEGSCRLGSCGQPAAVRRQVHRA